MTRAEILQEIKDIDHELNDRKHHNSFMQLRAYRRRRARLHKMIDSHAFATRHMPHQQLSLSL